MRTDRWLDSVGDYYNRFDIGNRIFITFEDFCEVVESGRWALYIDGICLPELSPFKTELAEVFLNCSEDKNQGYSARLKENKRTRVVHYGLGLKARMKALSHVKELQLS